MQESKKSNVKEFFRFALNVFGLVVCCVLLVYLWGSSVSSVSLYFSSVFQAMRDMIEPIGSIILAVLVGFIFLKAIPRP